MDVINSNNFLSALYIMPVLYLYIWPCVPISFQLVVALLNIYQTKVYGLLFAGTSTWSLDWTPPRLLLSYILVVEIPPILVLQVTGRWELTVNSTAQGHRANSRVRGPQPRYLLHLLFFLGLFRWIAKTFCVGILLIWSTKWSLFTNFFAQMSCKSRDKSNDAN